MLLYGRKVTIFSYDLEQIPVSLLAPQVSQLQTEAKIHILWRFAPRHQASVCKILEQGAGHHPYLLVFRKYTERKEMHECVKIGCNFFMEAWAEFQFL